LQHSKRLTEKTEEKKERRGDTEVKEKDRKMMSMFH